MDSISLTAKSDGIKKTLMNLLDRSKAAQTFLMRNIYRMYQNFQRERWMTEGSSEGNKWDSLSTIYASRKRIIYGGGPKYEWIGGQGEGRPWRLAGSWPSYPGAGTKIMIATGRLESAAVGPGGGITTGGEQFHKVLATNNSLTVSLDATKEKSGKDIGSKYFKYANDDRNFMKFGTNSINAFKAEISLYLKNGRGSF